ncbi:MAG: hypothetical protein L0Z70_04005 [Chloroflexi bacterium]|nr:hypothetical protein [Chloroflexota bacterium]
MESEIAENRSTLLDQSPAGILGGVLAFFSLCSRDRRSAARSPCRPGCNEYY